MSLQKSGFTPIWPLRQQYSWDDVKYCANILIFSNFLGRKVSLESNNVIVEKYTPNAKYPMDYFYPGPPLDQSGSNSSTSQYRVSLFSLMYISLTVGFQINVWRTIINFQYYSHPYALIWDRTFINLWTLQPKSCLFHKKKCFYKVS